MLSIKSNIAEFTRDLDYQARTQIPIATAWAINDLADRVIVGEMAEILKDFPTATPFTSSKNAWDVIRANKANPFATVFMKDAQERYMDPYTDGGMSVPTPGGAMVVPVKVPVNQYGNIPYKKLQNLMKSPSVFYASKGNPKFHGAKPYSGVFQRIQYGTGPKGGKLTHLVTLAKMQDPWDVKQHWAFEQRAQEIVERNVQDAMEQALMRALASMR